MADLTVKQEKFIHFYTLPGPSQGNASHAARMAGYSPKDANVQGPRLLANVRISTAIKKRMDKLNERAIATSAETLALIEGQAFADANELCEHRIGSCRYCWGENNRYQRTASEMESQREFWEEKLNALLDSTDPKDQEKAQRMGEFDLKGGIGYNPTIPPNPDCGECFGLGKSYEVFKDTRNLTPAARALYAGVQRTKDGLKINMNSQDTARALMAKHHGLVNDKLDVNISEMSDDKLLEIAKGIADKMIKP